MGELRYLNGTGITEKQSRTIPYLLLDDSLLTRTTTYAM
jgi:hypothetical protein